MSEVRLHDTLTGETRPFVPLRDEGVRIYSCGPTVYGPAHIGNFRSFLFADLLVRYLRWRGHTVRWVMNITDIDDKIIRGAAAAGESISALADRYLERFLADAETLRMTRPDVLPRATEHIDHIVSLIETLLERGHAYRTDEGSIFFRISSWPAYGRLARLDPEQLRVGERVEADEYAKDDVRDFALWKGPKPDEPSWPTPIGEGRPGWHIECSAMSMAHLGPSFDIHTGGVDLDLPAPRGRDRPERGGHGRAIRRDLAALRAPPEQRHEDGEIDEGTSRASTRSWRPACRRGRCGTHCWRCITGLAWTTRTNRWRRLRAAVTRLDTLVRALETYAEPGHRRSGAAATYWPALGAISRRRSTTTSTSRRPGRACSISSETSTGVSRRGRSRRTMPLARLATLRDLDEVLGVLPDAEADVARSRSSSRCSTNERPHAPLGTGPLPTALRDALADRGISVEDTRDGQRWHRIAEVSRG